jgi:hypothetical protein
MTLLESLNSLEVTVVTEFFHDYFTGGMQQYKVPASFLQINFWSDLKVGKIYLYH